VLAGEKRWHAENADSIDAIATIPDASVDAIVCDPPAGISFMARGWDSDKGGRDAWIDWLRCIMSECLRVLKPGGHALVWAIPRTSHWTGTAIELAGFEVRDVVTHLFGSGMPKSKNISLAIDKSIGIDDQRAVVHSYTAGGNAGTSTKAKGGTYVVGAPNSKAVELKVTKGANEISQRFDGWGTGLKPAVEFWFLARKPCVAGSLYENALKYGTGGININATRIPTDWKRRPESWHRSGHSAKPDAKKIAAPPGKGIQCHPLGLHPANLTIDDFITEQLGDKAQFFYVAKTSTKEREAGCESLPKRMNVEIVDRGADSAGINNPRAGAGRTSSGRANHHPTVKPLALMRWLVRLVTPPGGIVLDPFMGSGSTGCAAVLEGLRFIGIELDADYVRIAESRIAHWEKLQNNHEQTTLFSTR
jgi:DNA modification methylase